MSFRDNIRAKLDRRLEEGLRRTRVTTESPQGIRIIRDGKTLINFSSNDYLGLASSNELKAAAKEGVDQWGVGAAASHLICGHQSPHDMLEKEIAQLVGAQKAIVFSTGYMANLAAVATFLDRHDLLLQDRLNHASLIDAGLVCRATSRRFRHLDVGHATELIETATSNAMIATDGVFSMDGSVANVSALVSLCDRDDRMLLVDDAHGFGVLGDCGAGTLQQTRLMPTGQCLMIGTLSKAVGSLGAFVAGDGELIEHLVQFARPYIYTTALPPAIAQASRESLRLFESQAWRREKLFENVATFRSGAETEGIELLPSETAIQSVVFESAIAAVEASDFLAKAGFLVVAIRPPTVPPGTSRLRITLSALHEVGQIQSLVQCLARVAGIS